ncbi:enoyl-CoA hydratase/isomerase family protein [Bordetella petrii]|uniref:enoyl-CoA hydratase/isomerase family protein n=1 Tax=Bordetella petrii TaxID=94624 RepID=UPI001E3ED473|nr:enoyl-CoA hydratase-related protein [Bordetella petrii]MCD0503020.1 enoyl-CoA hydratase-related protein [Bordetella petrii]
MTQTIIEARDGDVLRVTINRPAKRNALDMQMFQQLADILLRAEQAPDVGGVLLAGEGEHFCAGHDLQAFAAWPQNAHDPVPRFLHALAALRKPLVVAVQGWAVGIGATLLLHADWTVAAPDAQLCLPFIDREIAPEAGSSLLLAQCIGLARARRLLLSGQPIDGQTAFDWGWLTELAEPGQLLEAAAERARMLATKSSVTYGQIKDWLAPQYDIRHRIDEEIDAINHAIIRRGKPHTRN